MHGLGVGGEKGVVGIGTFEASEVEEAASGLAA